MVIASPIVSRWRSPEPSSGRLITALLLFTALAAGVGFARSPALGVAIALAPLALLGFTRPALLAVLGVGLTYVVTDVTGGSMGLQVSVGDLLLLLAVLGWLVAVAAGDRSWPRGELRPVTRPLLLYAALLALVVAVHLDAGSLIDSAQRLQIVVVGLVVGAFVLGGGDLRRALAAYLVVTSAMAVVYVATFDGDVGFGNQKNPAGHFMALAILVAAGSDVLGRLRLALLVPLAIGLFTTGSRGALVGLVAGLVVLPLLLTGRDRRRVAVLLVPVLASLAFAYTLLPEDARDRLSTVEAGGTLTSGLDPGQYTIALREEYWRDALAVIAAQPWAGVGIDNYLAGDPGLGTLTDDPHNVFLLEAAEGGLPLAAGLTVLLLGSVVLVYRRRHQTPLAAVAGSVQVACIVHGLVDIYWVRGSAVLGWVLVGAALADAHRRRSP